MEKTTMTNNEYKKQLRFILTTDYDYCQKTTALQTARQMGFIGTDKLSIADVIAVWKEAFEED